MNSVLRQIGCVLGALVLAGGCASSRGAGQGFDGRAKQADEKLPRAERFYDEAEQKLVADAQAHQSAARKAIEEGSSEKARAEGAAAAERYARFADTFPASEWRITFRYDAARFFLFALEYDRAAVQADKVLAEPAANDVTRAMAAQVAATAWRGVAAARIKAGELEAPRLATVQQRGGAALAPRPVPEAWQHFVSAVDAYVAVWEKHPEATKLRSDRSSTLTPWSAALVAAEIQYFYDHMEEARKRLERIVETWPGEAEVMESAVQDLFQAYLVLGNDRAVDAAKGRLLEVVEAQGSKAQDARAKEIYARLREQLTVLVQWHDFLVAKRLLDSGKSAEAAEAFEAFAAAHPAAKDASTALFNAALGWDKAEKADKAAAAREAVVAKYGDSKVAPLAALQLASEATKREDHEGAARHYETYLEKWPEAPNRCIAQQNLGHELDVQGKKTEAAERYLAFGKDARCRKERPNDVAKALYRSGKLFKEAKLKPRAKEAFEASAGLDGVSDPSAKSLIDDAKLQAKRL